MRHIRDQFSARFIIAICIRLPVLHFAWPSDNQSALGVGSLAIAKLYSFVDRQKRIGDQCRGKHHVIDILVRLPHFIRGLRARQPNIDYFVCERLIWQVQPFRLKNCWDCPQADRQAKLAKGETLGGRPCQKPTAGKRPNTAFVGIFDFFIKIIITMMLGQLGKPAGIKEQAAYSQGIACAPIPAPA